MHAPTERREHDRGRCCEWRTHIPRRYDEDALADGLTTEDVGEEEGPGCKVNNEEVF